MSIVKIAINTSCLGQDVKKALQVASALGAEGVTLDARSELRPEEMGDTAIRHLRKILSDLGLEVALVTFSTRLGFSNPEWQEQRLAAAKSAMKMAFQLGASSVSSPLGAIPSMPDPDAPEESGSKTNEAWHTLVEALLDLGNYSEHIGAKWLARTSGASVQDLKSLLDFLPNGCMGIDLHPADLIRIRESPAEAVEVLGPAIWHVHACDAVRDFAAGTTEEVQLGRGTADFEQLLGGLEGYGYRGWCTIGRSGNHVQEDIALAVKYLRAIQ